MRSSVSARQPVNQIVGISDYFIITFVLYVLPVYASFFTPSCLTVIQAPEEQAGCCMWSKAESVLWPRPSFGVTDSLLCESPPLSVGLSPREPPPNSNNKSNAMMMSPRLTYRAWQHPLHFLAHCKWNNSTWSTWDQFCQMVYLDRDLV